MAKLILTPEEEAAASWMDFDDASLGQVVKRHIAKIIDKPTTDGEQEIIHGQAAAFVLISLARLRKADELTFDNSGMTFKGEPIGDWKIEITKRSDGEDTMKCAICHYEPDRNDPDDDLLGCPTCGRFACIRTCADPEFGYCVECMRKESERQQEPTP